MSELAKALLAFQKDAPRLHKAAEAEVKGRTKDGREYSYRYRYLDFTDAMEAIRPKLNEHGLVVIQTLADLDGSRFLHTILRHAESAEQDVSSLRLPALDDMQELGKAITYARRYSLVAMLGLVADEDTDGKSAGAGEVSSSEGRGAAPAEHFPPSIPETKPRSRTKGQLDEMRNLLTELEMQENRRDPTWATLAREFAEEQLDVKPGQMATEPQMDTILEYMRGFLKVPA